MLMVSICCNNEYLIFSDIYLNDVTFFFARVKSMGKPQSRDLELCICSHALALSVQKECCWTIESTIV